MSKQVLIVDDDRSLARALVRAVKAEGYEAEVVHDGDAAVRTLQKAKPGLVLLDLLLPKRDGRAVLAWIRGREDTRELPVVAMSGIFRSRSHASDLLSEGAQAFLDKPFRRSDLRSMLRRHLGRPPEKNPEASKPETISLAKHPVTEVLWEKMNSGFTGTLEFRQARRLKVLLLEEGRPARIRSNLARECLGQRLATEGNIERPALDESVRRMKDGKRRQGEILVEMGELSAEQLAGALQRQADEKLLQLFTWTEGELTPREDVTEVAQATDLVGWTPRRTVLAGVEFMSPSRAEKHLSRYRERDVVRADVRVDEAEAGLPVVARLLEALGQPTSVRHLALDHPGALYGLAVIGALRLELKESEEAGVSLDDLESRLESSRDQSYFEILGVSQDDKMPQVRRAFLQLAKRYHPDRMTSETQYTRQVAAELFARMSEAHDTLSDPEQRKVYVEALRAKTSGGDGPATTAIVAAEMQFQRGEAMFRKRDYAGAVERFRSALDLNDHEGEFHAYFGWASALASPGDDDVRTRADEHLAKALKLAPKSVTGYYFSGLHRKACGEADLAERMFRKVLELQPNHVEASREIRLATIRRQKDQGDGGLFGFKRKK